jgi:hypothetical protein
MMATLLQQLTRALLLASLFWLAAAWAETGADSQQIQEITQQINTTAAEQIKLLNAGTKISAAISEKEKEKKGLQNKIRQWNLTAKKLTIDAREGSKKANTDLAQVQFEIKRAQFTITKIDESIEQLRKEQENNRKEKRVLKTRTDDLLAQLESIKKGNTAKSEQKPASQPPAPVVAQKPLPEATPKEDKTREEAEKKRIAAEEEKKRVAAAEAEKQRLADDAEKQRIATEEEKKRIAAAEAEKQRLADEERKRMIREQQEEQAKLAALEKQKQEELYQQQQQKQQQAAAKPATPPPAENPSIQDQVRRKFITNSSSLPPAESALTLAMARALDSSASQPVRFSGDNLTLQVANPAGAIPHPVGTMKHLGNNQYMIETRIQRGKQIFQIGNFQFHKNIPDHFDGIRCLILIDARNENNPVFEMVVAGG